MNYIGSKLTLRPFLEEIFHQIRDGTERVFCDIFAGTGAAGRLFKSLGMNVIANDIQYYAYVLNNGRLETQGEAKQVREMESVRKAYLGL